jgi:hypothetical protein
MFNNTALDVVIGLVFIYLLYSLLASIVQEIIATQLAFRSKVLEKAILRMLEDGKITARFPLFDRVKGFWQMVFRTNRLKDKKFAANFYGHPLIKYLAEDNWFSKPGYLSSGNFSKIIVDLLNGINTQGAAPDLQTIQQAVNGATLKQRFLPVQPNPANPAEQALQEQKENPTKECDINPNTQLYLQSLLTEAQGDLNKFKQLLEAWFDETMQRASGWYKRYVQAILFVLGMAIAIAFNVDSIRIAKKLTKDPKLREQMVQSAGTWIEKNEQMKFQMQDMKSRKLDTTNVYKNLDTAYQQSVKRTDSLVNSAKKLINTDIEGVNNILGLGYEEDKTTKGHPPKFWHGYVFCYKDIDFTSFIGWLITALAISLGAPFWFDLLSKLMRVRGALKSSDSDKSQAAATPVVAPVTVTVNSTKPGEEAVG